MIGQTPATADAADGTQGPEAPRADTAQAADPTPVPAPSTRPDPTRYGDWERNGRCIDF